VTPKRTALIFVTGGDGTQQLMFGAVAQQIRGIEAIEDQDGRQ
jgi:hypothetical protein